MRKGDISNLSSALQSKENVTETAKSNKQYINKQMMHSFQVNIRICRPSKVMVTLASPQSTSFPLLKILGPVDQN